MTHFEVFATVSSIGFIDTGDKLSLTGDKLSPVSLLLAINYRRCCYWQIIFDGVVETHEKHKVAKNLCEFL
jgi:uncharacterized protein (DUF2235 family)